MPALCVARATINRAGSKMTRRNVRQQPGRDRAGDEWGGDVHATSCIFCRGWSDPREINSQESSVSSVALLFSVIKWNGCAGTDACWCARTPRARPVSARTLQFNTEYEGGTEDTKLPC